MKRGEKEKRGEKGGGESSDKEGKKRKEGRAEETERGKGGLTEEGRLSGTISKCKEGGKLMKETEEKEKGEIEGGSVREKMVWREGMEEGRTEETEKGKKN